MRRSDPILLKDQSADAHGTRYTKKYDVNMCFLPLPRPKTQHGVGNHDGTLLPVCARSIHAQIAIETLASSTLC